MVTSLEPGLYVAAVSGGVDSVVLLHMLRDMPDVRVVVAHYDHGIRDNSHEDRQHVAGLAKQYGLPFVFDEGDLGSDASEAMARNARYEFLHKIREQSGAQAVVTAHHQDDVLETSLLNLLRGTHRKGLASLKSTDVVKRPLLHLPKKQLVSYARANGLVWREDPTNEDLKYRRNYVRHRLVKRMTPEQREHLHDHIRKLHELNRRIDALVANQLHVQASLDTLDRRRFIALPHAVAQEVLAAWLRRAGMRGFDRRGLTRMVAAAKTYAPGRKIDVNGQLYIDVNARSLALNRRGR